MNVARKRRLYYYMMRGGVSAVAPAFTSSAPTAFPYGVAITHVNTASGSPAPTFSITSGAAPTGVTLNADGTWSGTPTASGNFTFTVTATNAGGTADQAATVLVSYASKVLYYAPVQFLKLTDATGAADSSGNGRTGAVSGATPNAIATPFGDMCYSFDKINDSVNISSTGIDLSGDFAVSLWVKSSTSTPGSSTVFDTGSATNDRIRFRSSTGSQWTGILASTAIAPSPVTNVDTNWHHWGLQYISGNAKVFLDGTATDIGAVTHAAALTIAFLGRERSGNGYWGGGIAYFAVYESEISDAVMLALATP